MGNPKDQRSCERIPLTREVKVVSMGRIAACAIAINVGMGGVLLNFSQPLPVGSQCRVAIPVPGKLKSLEAEGIVVRASTGETAIKFMRTLERSSFEALFQPTSGMPQGSILAAYQAYFRVSRNKDLADCEKLLGVSKQTYRTTFYITFLSCISLAILPVWLFRDSLPALSNWIKVVLSFGYGTLWLAVLQPTIDLTVFHFLKQRPSS